MKGIMEMYTLVFEEGELRELDAFVNGNFSMESVFEYMIHTRMDYDDSIEFLTALSKIEKAAKKVRAEMLERCGE